MLQSVRFHPTILHRMPFLMFCACLRCMLCSKFFVQSATLSHGPARRSEIPALNVFLNIRGSQHASFVRFIAVSSQHQSTPARLRGAQGLPMQHCSMHDIHRTECSLKDRSSRSKAGHAPVGAGQERCGPGRSFHGRSTPFLLPCMAVLAWLTPIPSCPDACVERHTGVFYRKSLRD